MNRRTLLKVVGAAAMAPVAVAIAKLLPKRKAGSVEIDYVAGNPPRAFTHTERMDVVTWSVQPGGMTGDSGEITMRMLDENDWNG